MRLDHLLSKEKEVGIVLLLSIQRKQETAEMDMNLLVAMRLRETPVPIPNTTVKKLVNSFFILFFTTFLNYFNNESTIRVI